MGACCSKKCNSDKQWKPFVVYSVKNVVVNTLVSEPSLVMVKDCPCKKCSSAKGRPPNDEEAIKYAGLLKEAQNQKEKDKEKDTKRVSVRSPQF